MRKQKTILFLLLAVVVIGGLVIYYRVQASDTPSRKIVVFQVGVTDIGKNNIIGKAGGVKFKDLDLVRGKAVWLSNKAAEKLAKQPGVLRIDDDVVVSALAKGGVSASAKPAPKQPAQVLPWGIDKIDAELVWLGNTADPIRVAIIDTGIDISHSDLMANIKGGLSAVVYTTSYNDDNGHGTHVAGIVAGINNTIGVVGAAPAADLYAVKVLDRNGSGYLSDVIEGIEWAITNNMQAINMSLGTASDIQSFHDAVISAKNAGIVVVAAAGNNGGTTNESVIFPAAYPEAIAVSATDKNNVITYWSSRGPEVDLSAPGVSIYSTYKGSTYATLSGTSMAAPHVTGAVALVLNTAVGVYDVNTNGKWDPSEVQKKLQDRATDLGISGFDNLYGYGLVNAYKAVQP